MRKSPGFPPASSWLQNSNRNLPLEGLASHLAVITRLPPKAPAPHKLEKSVAATSDSVQAAGCRVAAEPLAEAKINKLLGLKVLIKKC